MRGNVPNDIQPPASRHLRRAALSAACAAMLLALGACSPSVPDAHDIARALQPLNIYPDVVRRHDCTPTGDAVRCVIIYLAQGGTEKTRAIFDRELRVHLEFERVGNIWRVRRVIG